MFSPEFVEDGSSLSSITRGFQTCRLCKWRTETAASPRVTHHSPPTPPPSLSLGAQQRCQDGAVSRAPWPGQSQSSFAGNQSHGCLTLMQAGRSKAFRGPVVSLIFELRASVFLALFLRDTCPFSPCSILEGRKSWRKPKGIN